MKLRNKQSGEILEVESIGHADSLKGKCGYQVTLSWEIGEHLNTCKTYNSLAELNAEWEDYEEPKEYWAIDQFGEPINVSGLSRLQLEKLHRLGNDFPSENATMKAIEKLKAWTRLKDMGFKIKGIRYRNYRNYIEWDISQKVSDDHFTGEDFNDALHLLFGGEE